MVQVSGVQGVRGAAGMPRAHPSEGSAQTFPSQAGTVSGLVGTVVSRKSTRPIKGADAAPWGANLLILQKSEIRIFNVKLSGLFNVGNQFQLC